MDEETRFDVDTVRATRTEVKGPSHVPIPTFPTRHRTSPAAGVPRARAPPEGAPAVRARRPGRGHIGQGVIVNNTTEIESTLCSLADTIRVGDDFGTLCNTVCLRIR